MVSFRVLRFRDPPKRGSQSRRVGRRPGLVGLRASTSVNSPFLTPPKQKDTQLSQMPNSNANLQGLRFEVQVSGWGSGLRVERVRSCRSSSQNCSSFVSVGVGMPRCTSALLFTTGPHPKRTFGGDMGSYMSYKAYIRRGVMLDCKIIRATCYLLHWFPWTFRSTIGRSLVSLGRP